MKLSVPKERRAHERRVAATPDSVKKLIGLGFEVTIEKGAGENSAYKDEAYEAVGAKLADDPDALYSQADVVLKVQRPLLNGEGELDELALINKSAALVSVLSPYNSSESLEAYASAGVTSVAMDFIPRITRAQSMDVLSSQSNLSGYRAVLDAANEFGRAFPMLMTAAGTVAPAKVMVLGAGVAGLQAIATAKRLGAVVSATDVRPAAKEQVESLGGKFVMVDSEEVKQAETAGGYAKEMSEDFKQQQAKLIADTIEKQDIVICTALIPGRKAPNLVNDDMVHSMRVGSVIIDLAVEQGGNCTLSQAGEVVSINGVKVVGHFNAPSRVATDASSLYANNLVNFLKLIVIQEDEKFSIHFDFDDEIISASVLTHQSKIVHPNFKVEKGTE